MRKANAGQSATETPTEEADTWRLAQLLVDRLGAEARAHAANRANELLDIGDRAGHALWMEIIRALDRLLSTAKGSPD
jgi:hypothetical protein